MFLWALPIWTGLLFWLIFGVRGWFGHAARELRRRKQLAAFFAVHDGTGRPAAQDGRTGSGAPARS
jgi:hypothetical protein